jgi:hypothetical protein
MLWTRWKQEIPTSKSGRSMIIVEDIILTEVEECSLERYGACDLECDRYVSLAKQLFLLF